MSYVPPHLRKSIAATATTTTVSTTATSTTLDNNTSNHKLNSKSINNAFSNAAPRRSSANNHIQPLRGLAVPNVVFPQWKPSERVLRLKPEQIEEVRLRLNVDVTVTPDSPPAPAPIESFTDMCLASSIMKDIAIHEYTTPTSIQAQAMPVALSGRDLLGCAETGSGKTAAFTIPMIQHCIAQPSVRRGDGPLALVLAPTRELAQQIEKEVKAFSQSLESFRTAIVVGGTNIADQRSELRAGVDIVVATPGRFIDHLQQGNTSLTRISYVVLDEADRMLDMGFEPQIREVMHNLPEKHQTLLFSATMPVEIEALAQEYLTNPVQVKVGKVSSPTENVSQTLEKISESEKIDRLLSLLVEEAALAEKLGHPFPLTIVFVERKVLQIPTRCDEVAEALVAQGLNAVALHGGRTQSEREGALRDFRHGPTNILVCQGAVKHIFDTMEDYVHRIGRTGRAGSTGRATSFYTDRDMFLVSQIRKAIADVQSGNTVAFATGKVARRKEREAAAAQKEARIAQSKLPPTSINVEDKYKYMIATEMIKKEGAADDAWDD
ncbi:DNA/RNA helicase, DEAD/DEAH box type, N-terminal [Cynara cardunculus var. scolymus]|uniref:RNA helicase n=1 Tax=Cynara cardunculus var. scolymus TaxID=59895 RepID=A0A124SFM4_CYNCS|nr:DNA/RNA helicase, DEAD/DEAH box type, N-terminal [Cynara cardunculus var. scolymus]